MIRPVKEKDGQTETLRIRRTPKPKVIPGFLSISIPTCQDTAPLASFLEALGSFPLKSRRFTSSPPLSCSHQHVSS